MTGISAFPKIFALGTRHVQDIFNGPVEVTEKIDGSQFAFGWLNGELVMRSKGTQIFPESADKMFTTAVDYVTSIPFDPFLDNTVFYCEYLQRPRHNVLAYERVPTNHLMLFGVYSYDQDVFAQNHTALARYAGELGIEAVPVLWRGDSDSESVIDMLEARRVSVLGGAPPEGVVVKNFWRSVLLSESVILPVMSAKYVSERFKEVHRQKKDYQPRDRWNAFKESFRTEARWDKAIQHLAEAGELEYEPRDIGKLIKEIQRDITEEEQDEIRDFLWREFGKELLRKGTAGVAEYYKEQLALGRVLGQAA